MADAAPAAVPSVPGTAGNQSGTGTALPANAYPDAKPGETRAQTVARIKADLGDGEQEYDPQHLIGLAQRGKKTAQIMSKAEQRAQEAMRLQQEADGKLARLKSKDLRERRAALKELGFDEVEYAREIAREVVETEQLTPEQRRIRELEATLKADEEAKSKAKQEEEAKAQEAETKRHIEEFSNLFMEVVKLAGLPQQSASVVGYRLASMYQAAEGQVDPEVAAERIKDTLRKEHVALYRKPGPPGADGKTTSVLDVDALEAAFSPEDWKAINRRAVEKWRTGRQPGAVAQPHPQHNGSQPTHEEPERPRRGGNFWKDLDKRLR
jgi:hypothetical protein